MSVEKKLLSLLLTIMLLAVPFNALVEGTQADFTDGDEAFTEWFGLEPEVFAESPDETVSELQETPVTELESFEVGGVEAAEVQPDGEDVLIDFSGGGGDSILDLSQEDTLDPPEPGWDVPAEGIAIEAEVVAISLSDAALTLGLGETYALGFTCIPPEGSDGLALPAFAFESADAGIAAVDPLTGVIEAVSVGSTVVVASCGGQSALCEVVVKRLPEWIRFTQSLVYLREGEQIDLRALVELPEDCLDEITFTGLDGCSVDAAGIAVGSGRVLAQTRNGLVAEIEIIDPVAARTVRISRDAQSLLVGGTYPLQQILQIAPDDIGLDYAAIRVEILDPEIAETDGQGGLVAKAVGTTTIIATLDNGSVDTGTLTVIDAETAAALEDIAGLASQYASGDTPQSVSINDPEIASGLDAVRGKEYAWTSRPICPDFKLTYGGAALVKNRDYCVQYRNNVEPGTAGILVVGLGTYTGTCAVTFRILPKPSVYLKPETLELGVGEAYRLAASDPGARFTTSNKKIVAVNGSGTVKGVKKGRAVVTMYTSSGEMLTCAITVKAKPTKVALSAKKLTLGIGQARALSVKLKPSGCRSGVSWSSSNPSVAIVENGTIIPLKAGKATITASTYNGKKAKCALTVKPAPTGVSMNVAHANINVKGSVTLKPVVSPAGAMSANTFSSSNTAVAVVNGSGKVTGKAPGTATITARTYNGYTAECLVTVWKAPSKVTLNRGSATLAVGMTLQLTSTVSPSDANPAVAWASSKKKIATVDKNGLVTAKKKGTVKIAVKTSNGKKAVCKITVKPKPKSIAVKAAKTTLYVGESTKAAAALTKKSYSPIEWYVDGDAVTVDQSGRITAVAEGVATVYARATAAAGLVAGVKITVRTAGNTTGAIIDISKWQGSIDFKTLKPAVSLVIARASCGTDIDSMFNSYAASMNSQKIPFGVYCYSKASTPAEAQAEARALYAYASKYKPKFYVMDAEEASITQAAIVAFVTELRSLGAAKVGAYVGHHRYTQYGVSAIRNKLDFVWIPRYGSNTGTIAGATRPDYPCDLWQFTSNGKVPGISGRVDMNVITGQGKSLGWFTS